MQEVRRRREGCEKGQTREKEHKVQMRHLGKMRQRREMSEASETQEEG